MHSRIKEAYTRAVANFAMVRCGLNVTKQAEMHQVCRNTEPGTCEGACGENGECHTILWRYVTNRYIRSKPPLSCATTAAVQRQLQTARFERTNIIVSNLQSARSTVTVVELVSYVVERTICRPSALVVEQAQFSSSVRVCSLKTFFYVKKYNNQQLQQCCCRFHSYCKRLEYTSSARRRVDDVIHTVGYDVPDITRQGRIFIRVD